MIETQDILFNVTGQTLVFDAPEGRPSSVTSVAIFENETGDDGTAESAAGSGSVETNPNTTFDGTAAVGTRTLPVAATTGIAIGRRYLATNSTGEKEWIEVAQISSGVSVTSRLPVENAYATADTFQSARMTATVDSTWIADTNNISGDIDPNPRYRVVWTYVVSSVTYRRYSYFDVVRVAGQHQVTALDVDTAYPGWFENLPTYYREDQGRSLIDEAYRQVKLDFYAQEKADQMARNGEVVNDLVLHRALVCAEMAKVIAGGGSPEAVKQAGDLYQLRLQGLISHVKIPFATDSGGAAVKVASQPVWRR